MLLPLVPARELSAQGADAPVVDGVTLTSVPLAGVKLYVDPDVDPETIATASTAIALGLAEVPELTGLPPFTTPIEAYVLEDEERFRLALAEIANVRTELVSVDIAGYTIERDGTMLIFFAAPNVTDPASATIGFAHELAHLGVREATQRKSLPQWFNEGYASWISTEVLARHHPDEAALQHQLDRLAVASALHTRGTIPWADLVTRVRFSRAGVDGLVNLAYGQSTLFVEFLARRHGVPALARFLTALGEGTAATPAFATAFGPFGGEVAQFDASLATLKAELPPGLYIIQRASNDRPAVVGAIGGPTLEPAVVEFLVGGELMRRREIDFDGSGMLVASLPASLFEDAGGVRLRVTAPVLGVLELDPLTEMRAQPVVAPAPSVAAPPAPVQIPARRSLRPSLRPGATLPLAA